jgi:hypothetical protein
MHILLCSLLVLAAMGCLLHRGARKVKMKTSHRVCVWLIEKALINWIAVASLSDLIKRQIPPKFGLIPLFSPRGARLQKFELRLPSCRVCSFSAGDEVAWHIRAWFLSTPLTSQWNNIKKRRARARERERGPASHISLPFSHAYIHSPPSSSLVFLHGPRTAIRTPLCRPASLLNASPSDARRIFMDAFHLDSHAKCMHTIFYSRSPPHLWHSRAVRLC